MDNSMTFLSNDQIFGNNQLEILKKYGTKCAITDFAILLGGYVSTACYTSEGNQFKDRTGWWWTKSSDGYNSACVVDEDGTSFWDSVNGRSGGVRPALPYSSIQSIYSNEVISNNGIKEIAYGEYPQTIVDEYYSRELERVYNNRSLRTTGKNYTTDSVRYEEDSKKFNARIHTEYEYNGSKYIRFVGDSNCDGQTLSNGRKVIEGQPYWVKVEPIIWLVDERANIALSKRIVFSGVQFNNINDYYDGDFSKTDIKQFMDNYFAKEIIVKNNLTLNKNTIDLSSIDLSLLSDDQVFDENQLDVIKKYGTKAAVTDLAIILGAYYSENDFVSDDNSLTGRVGWWWTSSNFIGNAVCIINRFGDRSWHNVDVRVGGVRPVLPYSLVKSNSLNKGRGANGINIIQCGEYPQMAVDNETQKKLNSLFKMKAMNKTGRNYTFDQTKTMYNIYDKAFDPVTYEEYMYEGKKYIRVRVNSSDDGSIITLSSELKCQDNDYIWIEVLPIDWLVDEKSNIAFTKKILVSGIRYDDVNKYDGNFDKTEMHEYLNKYMKKDIFQSVTLLKQNTSDVNNRKQNPYGFNFDNVTEEDIIKGAVESNVSVFLHGRSSEGKSARVKQLDKDAEIIYMRNVTPDSLNGKSVYVQPITKRVEVPVKKIVNIDGEEKEITITEYQDVIVKDGYMMDVKPSWLVNVEEKCTKEPDKIHIIFFDELTNALPSIQGMAFNIILDGEVNGKWKLPENARIVAAGNDLEDSLAANKLAEPLFNRFAHVYINTTVDSWLKWAVTQESNYERIDYVKEESKPKIHPAIYAYIAYKSFSNMDVLRTPYTGDRPNADPRKWEMASKILYKTKKPEMLRALIGDDLTRDFKAFTSIKVITVEDVISNNYTDQDLVMDVSQAFATAVGLSSVDEENFEVVRDFMKKLGAEVRSAFESMWAHGDEERLEKIAELQLKDNGGIKR